MRRTIALGAALIAACAAPPAPRNAGLPVEPPETWVAGEVAEGPYAVAGDWWRDFGDPRLDRCVLEALLNNPGLKQAEARVRQAAALARIAGADLKPAAAIGGQAGRSRNFIGSFGFGPSTVDSESYGVSLDLSWEIDLWGRIRAGRAAALSDLAARAALFRGAQLSLAAQTAKAYFAVIDARGQVAVAQADLDSARELERHIRGRFRRGLRTALDLKLARTEVERARSTLAVRGRVRDSALRQLEALLGRYPEGRLEVAPELPAAPDPAPAGVPADVIARRPDLVAAQHAADAALQRVAEAEASLYPRIALTGSAGLASTDLGDLVRGRFGVWSLVGNLSAPVFQGGRLRANVDLQHAREEEALAAFANAALDAFREVESALSDEGHLREQQRALDALATEAEASVELSDERYRKGLATVLDVLEARRRRFAARSEQLTARRLRLEARIDLFAALGGGFAPEEGSP